MERKNSIQATIKEFGNRHPEIKLTKSAISDNDIAELEMKFHVTIPNAVKDYLQSYTLSVPLVTGKMLGDFSSTYCEENGRWREMDIDEEIATTTLALPLMFPNFDLSEFEKMNRFFIGSGYLWLGTYNENDYVLVEIQSEQVLKVDMGRIQLTSGGETRADILRWALPFFHNVEDLVRCFFGGELYDEDELTFDVE